MKRSMKQIVSIALALVMTLGALATVFTVDSMAASYSGSSPYMSGKYYTNLINVTLTGDQRLDIANIGESQIGYREGNSYSELSGTYNGSGNYTEYGDWYGLYDMWCAMFVSWCAYVAGVSTDVVPKHAYTPSGLSFFKNQGTAYSRAQVAAGEYTPQCGDIIYFKSPRNSNPTNHVGIVTDYANGTVYTVEGNTSSSAYSSNGGVVAPHTYSISNTYIVYICKPNYPAAAPATSVTVPELYKDWVFDARYYADNYPDLKATYGYDEAGLLEHFQRIGVKEGRVASALFDVKYYTEQSPDLATAFGTDYVAAFNHFIGGGSSEPRKFSPTLDDLHDLIFDVGVYYARYKDLQEVYDFNGAVLFEHFMLHGLKEGRVASPFFDVNWYVNQNGDLKAAFGANYWAGFKHLISDGSTSQHKASAVVDTKYYTARHADLDGFSTVSAMKHYKDYGAQEGRRASAEFNAEYYYANNPDIQAAYSVGSACYHYMRAGFVEGRAGSDDSLLSGQCSYFGTNFMAKLSFTNSGKNLTVLDEGGTVSVVLASPSSAQAQKWNFVRQSDGSYKIKNTKNGYFLTMDVATHGSSAVSLKADENSPSQRWFLYLHNGNYIIRPAAATDVVLDVPGASTADNTKIQGYISNMSDSQYFTISKVR